MKIDLKNINIQLLLYTRRFLWVGIGMGIAAALVFLFAILPLVQQVYDLNDQVQQQTRALQSLQQKIQALNVVSDLTEFQDNDKVELALPSEKPLLPLLASVNGIAKNANVAVSDIETSPGRLATGSAAPNKSTNPGTPAAVPIVTGSQKPANAPYEVLTIQVTVKGQLKEINSFIEQVEHATPMINVSQIELNSLEKKVGTSVGNNENTFEAKLNLTTYYFVKSILVGVDDNLPQIGEKEKTFLQSLASYTTIAVDKQQSIQGGGLNDLFGASGE
jgi:prefoldin subunit 5